MEARSSKLRKTSGPSAIRKSKNELLQRRTFSRSLRPSVDRKRDIPPLTPLHRLQRFKAIRDKNLRSRGRTSAENRFILKMDEVGSLETTATDKFEENRIKNAKYEPKNDKNDELVGGHEEQTLNGVKDESDKDVFYGFKDKETVNGVHLSKENMTNGHKDAGKVGFIKSPDIPSTTEDKIDLNSSVDEDLCLKLECEEYEDKIDVENSDSKSPQKVESENIVENSSNENVQKTESKNAFENSSNDSHLNSEGGSPQYSEGRNVGNEKSAEEAKELIESDAESAISETKKSGASSSGEVSETPEEKYEDSEDEEEINVDKLSTSTSSDSDEDTEPMQDAETREADAPSKSEMRKPDTTNKIYSLPTSASSFKSAYGDSISKISGRRAVRGFDRSISRKRKAEDDLDPSAIPSPRWKFFRPTITNLWSPRKNALNLSSTSTPFKNIEDSMTVNFDEDTVYINDPDLSISQSNKTSSSNKSRWGCSIM